MSRDRADAGGIVDCRDKGERRVNCPTPGIVMSRRQAAEALVMRLMSASIAATAISSSSDARSTQTPHSGGETRRPRRWL